MEKVSQVFGIAHKFCEICEFPPVGNTSDKLSPGDLFKVVFVENDFCFIKLFNYDTNKFKIDLYRCLKEEIYEVSEELFALLVPIRNSAKRLEIFRNKQFVLSLKVGNPIKLRFSCKNDMFIVNCVISKIGVVPKTGYGNYFCLKIQNPFSTPSNVYEYLKNNFYDAESAQYIVTADKFFEEIIIYNNQQPGFKTSVSGKENSSNFEYMKQNSQSDEFEEYILGLENVEPRVSFKENNHFVPVVNSMEDDNRQLQKLNDVTVDLKSTFSSSAPYFVDNNSRISVAERVTDVEKTRSLIDLDDCATMPTSPSLELFPNILPDFKLKNSPFRPIEYESFQVNTNYNLNREPSFQRYDPPRNEYISPSSNIDQSVINELKLKIEILEKSHNQKNENDYNRNNRSIQTRNKGRKNNNSQSNGNFPTGNEKRNTKGNISQKVSQDMCQCQKCFKNFNMNKMIRLTLCHHIFCSKCLVNFIDPNLNQNQFCPFTNGTYRCNSFMQESDFRKISESEKFGIFELEIKNEKNNALFDIKKTLNNDDTDEKLIFCNKVGCEAFWLISKLDNKNIYVCPVCEEYNCILCGGIHQTDKCGNVQQQDQRIKMPMTIPNRNEWNCKKCTCSNPMQSKFCQNCGNSKQDKWICPTCTVENFNFNTNQCEVCNAINKNFAFKNKKKFNDEEYKKLLQLEQREDIIFNKQEFVCSICRDDIQIGAGIILRNCLHSFCRNCIVKVIEINTEPEVNCPAENCNDKFQDCEIRGVVTQELYDKFLAISLREAKGKMSDGIQCCTPNCNGFYFLIEKYESFICGICLVENCIPCRAAHKGLNCQQYQDELFHTTDETGIATRKNLETMVKTGQARQCPRCNIVVIKNGGCAHMRCLMCKNDFNWNPQPETLKLK